MKSKFLLLLFLLFSAKNYSQTEKIKIDLSENDKLIYLDSTGLKTTEEDHFYYRIVKDYTLNKKNYKVLDYYKSGVLKLEGTSTNKESLVKNDLFTYYYENGNKKATANYENNIQEGVETVWYKDGTKQSVKNYVKGKLHGSNASWYDNGNQRSTSFYLDGGVNGKVTEWYKIGNKKSELVYDFVTTRLSSTSTTTTTEVTVNQFWDEDGVQKVTDGNGYYEVNQKNFHAEGKVKNGHYDGVWNGIYKDYNYSYSEIYKNQKLVSGVGTDKDNLTHNYTSINSKAQPKKGIEDFKEYMSERMKTIDRESGNILVSIDILVDGTVKNIKIKRIIGNNNIQEAIRLLKEYGEWSPGELRGRKVKSSFSTTIAIGGR